MAEYILLVAGSKDTAGFCELDMAGVVQSSNYKTVSARRNSVTLIGKDSSAFSGMSPYQTDYIAAAQSEKPSIALFQRGKSSPLFQCPMQEIVNCLTTDVAGTFLISGTRRGYIYIHDVRSGDLLYLWQGHLKAVSKLQCSADGQFLVSVGEDGLGRAWNLAQVLDPALTMQSGLLKSHKSNDNKLLTPFRSWNAHSLPVTDLQLLDTASTLRAVTCSGDRTVNMYDLISDSALARVSLAASIPAGSLDCLAISPALDFIVVGASTGQVATVALSVFAALGLSGATQRDTPIFQPPHVTSLATLASEGIEVIDAHRTAVTQVVILPDNQRFVTSGLDGFVKFYHLHTRQLLLECTPLLQKSPITNLVLTLRAESLALAVVKPTVLPLVPLKKYTHNSSGSNQSNTQSAAQVANDQQGSNSHNSSLGSNGAGVVLEKLQRLLGQSVESALVCGPVFLGASTDLNNYKADAEVEEHGDGVLSQKQARIQQQMQQMQGGEEEEDGADAQRSSVAVAGAAGQHKRAKREAEDDEEDFIVLPKVSEAPVQQLLQASSDEDEDEEADEEEEDEEDDMMKFAEEDEEEEEQREEDEDVNEEAEALRTQVAEQAAQLVQLAEETRRWKDLCQQMKCIISSTQQEQQSLPQQISKQQSKKQQQKAVANEKNSSKNSDKKRKREEEVVVEVIEVEVEAEEEEEAQEEDIEVEEEAEEGSGDEEEEVEEPQKKKAKKKTAYQKQRKLEKKRAKKRGLMASSKNEDSSSKPTDSRQKKSLLWIGS